MILFTEAKTKILERTSRLASQDILLDDALGCILVEDIISPIDLPPFDNSAMDGYAVNSAEVFKCLSVEVSQFIKAGDISKPFEPKTCAKIMTGAPIPEGADTVVPVEDVTVKNDIVTIASSIKNGQHVRYRGEDVKKGELVAGKGAVVNSKVIALLAALGFERIPVIPKPRITVLVTGSELQNTGTKLGYGKIFDSNSHALRAALKEIGIDVEVLLLADNKEKIYSTIKDSLKRCDILITIGGVSVGDYDYVKEAFRRSEVEEVFHKVAIKPGKPLYFGTYHPHPIPLPSTTLPADRQGERGNNKLIFGLPGNPVSCLITFDQFVKSAIYKMIGRDHRPQIKTAVATENLKGSKGKRDFLRGICEEDGDSLHVRPSGPQGSAMLRALATANCTIVIPEDKELVEKGEDVEIELNDATV